MTVTLPKGDLASRLTSYLEGLKDRHGLEDYSVDENVVLVWVGPEDLPAVLATAPETLGILHLSFITVVDRQGSFQLTHELLDLLRAPVRGETTNEGDEPVIGTVNRIYPTAHWHERGAHDLFGVAFK